MADAPKKLVNITIGTAGHIDHGKTTLVKLLTGCDTDTLAEEKKRGLTIDLGFAPCTLAGNRQIGIVDVPGHERFIRNMVAGASGIDIVMLVVAANDSVMPQTVEHLNIIELLGIKKGLVALTKIDMVDPDLVEIVKEDVAELLKGTVLEGASVCPLSSTTGAGFPEFYKTLTTIIDSVGPRSVEGIFRLPVESAFSVKGYGTIVAGIPASGSIRVGAEVELLPAHKKSRIRSMEVYGNAAQVARAGECAALNVTDLDHNEIKRGMAIAEPGYFEPSPLVSVRLRMLKNSPLPLKNRTSVRFHTGTSEAMATVVLLDSHALEPGAEALAQLRLDAPIISAPGDHYIVRANSPVVTIGGGQVLGTGKWKLKTGKQFVIEELSEKEAVLDDPAGRVEHAIRSKYRRPALRRDLIRECGLSEEAVSAILVQLASEKKIRKLSRQDSVIHVLNLEAEEERLAAELSNFHKNNPLAIGEDRIQLRERLRMDSALYDEILLTMSESGDLKIEGNLVRLASHAVELTRGDEDVLARLEAALVENKFSPPSPAEMAQKFGENETKVLKLLNLLVQRGAALHLGEDIYFHKDGAREAKERFIEHLRANEEGGAKTLKELVGTSRKYAYALLDYIDKVGMTVRVGNLRYLKSEFKNK
jgi:selenocysteine-specific elongation factor